MKCFARALDLKDDPQLIAEYLDYHKNVWPEVLENIEGSGIESMKIFVCGNRLFMYCEVPDDYDPKAKDYSKGGSNPRAAQWEELMRKYQQQVPAASTETGDWWTEMTLCFDLKEQLARK